MSYPEPTFAQITTNPIHQPPLYLGRIYLQPTQYSAPFEYFRYQSTDRDEVWTELDRWIGQNSDIQVEWI